MNRRSFLTVILGAVPALFLGTRLASDAHKSADKYAIYRTGSGLEFVRVPWSKDGSVDGQWVEAKLLRPKGEAFSPKGYFVETEDGLREIAPNDRALKLIQDGVMPSGSDYHDRWVVSELAKIWGLS